MPLVMDDVKVATHEKEWKCTNTLACLNLGMASPGSAWPAEGCGRPALLSPESCVGCAGSEAASKAGPLESTRSSLWPERSEGCPRFQVLSRFFCARPGLRKYKGVTGQSLPPASPSVEAATLVACHPPRRDSSAYTSIVGGFLSKHTRWQPAPRGAAPSPALSVVHSVSETVPSHPRTPSGLILLSCYPGVETCTDAAP